MKEDAWGGGAEPGTDTCAAPTLWKSDASPAVVHGLPSYSSFSAILVGDSVLLLPLAWCPGYTGVRLVDAMGEGSFENHEVTGPFCLVLLDVLLARERRGEPLSMSLERWRVCGLRVIGCTASC